MTEKHSSRPAPQWPSAITEQLIGLWDWLDINEEEEWWSPGFYELLGYEPGEIEPSLSAFKALLHPDDVDRTFAAVQAHFDDDVPYDVDYRLRTKSGEYRWFRARARVQRDERGKPRRMTGVIEDIHQRVLADAALRSQEARLSGIISSAMDAIITVDRDQHVVFFNEAAEKMFGCPGSSLEYPLIVPRPTDD